MIVRANHAIIRVPQLSFNPISKALTEIRRDDYLRIR